MNKVLTIAGSDCSGGAGIQADLKTMTALGCYGMSVITALTAQNTIGVSAIEVCTTEFIEKQMESVFTDIFPDAVKIGMVSSAPVIRAIAKHLKKYKPSNIVVDPVMVATSGSKLLDDEAVNTLVNELIPLATVITPNLFEAEILCGFQIKSKEDMIAAANKIGERYKNTIVIKGGHLENRADDLVYTNGEITWIQGERIDNANTHGTGCTLSSAIASYLAMGNSILDSVSYGKLYIAGALQAQLDFGKGSGPLNHCYRIGNQELNNLVSH